MFIRVGVSVDERKYERERSTMTNLLFTSMVQQTKHVCLHLALARPRGLPMKARRMEAVMVNHVKRYVISVRLEEGDRVMGFQVLCSMAGQRSLAAEVKVTATRVQGLIYNVVWPGRPWPQS